MGQLTQGEDKQQQVEARNVTRRGYIIKKPENFNDYVLNQAVHRCKILKGEGVITQRGRCGDMVTNHAFGGYKLRCACVFMTINSVKKQPNKYVKY